jgi:hypothetical protein
MATLVIHVLETELSGGESAGVNGQAVTNDAEDELQLSVAEILKRLRERQKFNPAEHGLPDSTTLLREDRDRRRGLPEILDEMRHRREANPLPPGAPDSVDLLREDRAH